MWKIFIFYLSIQIVNGNFTDPIYPVENPCLAILNRLSDTASAFLNCAVSRARPFKLCEGCVDAYARLQDLVGLLDKTYFDVNEQIKCKAFLENYDTIQIVAQLISFVQNIWSSSFCDNCITGYKDTNGTIDFSLTETTKTFIKKKLEFDFCIFNATGRMVPIIPIDLNVTLNTNVCIVCSTTYKSINDFFLEITQQNKNGVCMDIVDTMNYTRLLWSKIYECRRHDPDYMAVIGVSFFIPTVVLVFYVTALFKGERKQKKLSRQKRLTAHSASIAIFDSRTRLLSPQHD